MPSLAVTQPYAPRKLDLIDATDRSYRQIESSYAGLLQVQAAMTELQNAVDGVANSGAYFMPSSISEANRVTYEGYVDDVLDSAKTLIGLLNSIMTLT